MFFKRAGSKEKTVSTPPPAAISEERRQKPLAPSELRRAFDAKKLGFKTTAEIKPAAALIGQERALKAIEFGASIKAADFNVFVLGPRASGKTTAVKAHLAEVASAARAPADWVYVNNFEDANRPKALRLPGRASARLARAMIAAIDELSGTVPAAFEGEDYQARRRAIDEEFRSTPGAGAGGAQSQGRRPEHRHTANAARLRHGADARRQGGEARGLQPAARAHAPGGRGAHRGAAEGARGDAWPRLRRPTSEARPELRSSTRRSRARRRRVRSTTSRRNSPICPRSARISRPSSAI